MKPQAKEHLAVFIQETKEILDALSEEVSGPKYHYGNFGHIEFDWQMSLDFAKCADSAWRRLFCRLAHGEECGHKDFLAIKKAGKEAYKKIMRSFYGKGLGLRVSYNSIKFEISRSGMRIWIYVSPDSFTPGCGP